MWLFWSDFCDFYIEIAKERGHVTKGMKGQEVNDLQALAAAGAPVFTDDGKPILNEAVFTQALKEADALGIPVSLHEEDPEFILENGINAGSPAAAA